VVACLTVCLAVPAQVIDFEPNGLHCKTLTKSGVTVMFAYLHLNPSGTVQVN